MSQDFSLHEKYGDDEPIEAGSDRSFGCTVGAILAAIGAAKAFLAGGINPLAGGLVAAGAVLILLAIFAPARLSAIKRQWLKLGALISQVVNPIVLALLFCLVVTPMALLLRIVGKRPLRLAPDRAASSYWIPREPIADAVSSMRRQF